jgi:hypothetical protein
MCATLDSPPWLKRFLRLFNDAPSLLAALGYPGAAEAVTVDFDELLREARHQADLLRQPYLAPEHVCLAAARLTQIKPLMHA